MYPLVIDFECRDPSISAGKGAGWCYQDFEILGAAYKIADQPTKFTSNPKEIVDIVAGAKSIVCHNAQYDVGCLNRLGADWQSKVIIDTLILAKLFDNGMPSYSLDKLGLDLLGVGKDVSGLESIAELMGIKKYMSNMHLIFKEYPEVVSTYAIRDVDVTYQLAQFFKKHLYQEGLDLIPFYSDLIKSLVLARAKGVRIDLEQAEKSQLVLEKMMNDSLEIFYSYCPGVNINSTKQLSAAFKDLGLTPGVSDKGGDSVGSAWRKTQDHPAITALSDAKKYEKMSRDFVVGLVERVENGRIHPEMTIMGAAETGRFSSSNPNIQQIPKRDELASSLIRTLILPEEGHSVYSLDFSSQEPRLQVHYAYLAHCPGSEELREAFIKNPQHDLHQQVADLAGISRKEAKTINLGISYGMGSEKLAISLGISAAEAMELKKRYNKLTPYLSRLNKAVQDAGTKRGYIKTLLGRRVAMDMDAPYKALNKLIQGSAADQTSIAMVEAYRKGLNIMFAVHDEAVLTAASHEEARQLKEIMEKAGGLVLPCYTEICYGPNWGEMEVLP